MSLQSTLSGYFPDREPTWTDIAITVLTAVSIAPRFLSPLSPSWPAFAAGFAVFATALALASTRFGRQVGRWFRRIGVAGRAVVIGLFPVSLVIVFQIAPEWQAVLADVGTGGLLAVVLYMIVYFAVARGAGGSTPDRVQNS